MSTLTIYAEYEALHTSHLKDFECAHYVAETIELYPFGYGCRIEVPDISTKIFVVSYLHRHGISLYEPMFRLLRKQKFRKMTVEKMKPFLRNYQIVCRDDGSHKFMLL